MEGREQRQGREQLARPRARRRRPSPSPAPPPRRHLHRGDLSGSCGCRAREDGKAKKEEKTRRELESWSWLCQAAPLLADAGRSPAMALRLPLSVGAARGCEGEQNGMELGFSKGCGRPRVFVRPIRADDRRMAIQADQRPAAAGRSQACFWPRREPITGRIGGPPVGCWASGPGGRG
jgi:hypothetical protein